MTGIFFAAWRFRRRALADLRGRCGGHARVALVLLRGRQPAAPRQLLDRVLVEEPLADHFRGFAATVERDGGTTYADHLPCRRRRRATSCRSSTARRSPSDAPCCCWLPCTSCSSRAPSTPWPPSTTRWASCAAARTGPPPRDDVAAAFADFCDVHRAELERLIATRSTQTNEVGRCSSLLPGLCHVAAAVRLAGAAVPARPRDFGRAQPALRRLRLHLPGRRGRRRPHGRARRARPSPSSAPCGDDLTRLPELRLPAMAERVGLDLAPVNPFSDDEARWLLACLWPDNLARFERLRAALANVRAAAHPPRLERGDMLTDLPAWSPPCRATGHWWCSTPGWPPTSARRSNAPWPTGRRARHGTARCTTSTARALRDTWAAHPPVTGVAREGPDLATVLVHVGPGRGPAVRLADTHPHGYWIRWWPGPQ